MVQKKTKTKIPISQNYNEFDEKNVLQNTVPSQTKTKNTYFKKKRERTVKLNRSPQRLRKTETHKYEVMSHEIVRDML